jgi:CubicO group peptidase (beta-lactamase class C family)
VIRGQGRWTLSFGVLLLLVRAPAAAGTEPAFPLAQWQARPAVELGLDDARLSAVAAALGSRGCAIKHGYVVKAWGSQDQVGGWYSSAKPVLSTLLMFAVQEGKVRGFDQPLADFGWELAPKDRAMTFRHLASMTSGYARPEQPGRAWAYNDYAIQLYQKTLFDRVFQGAPEVVFTTHIVSERLACRMALRFARPTGG